MLGVTNFSIGGVLLGMSLILSLAFFIYGLNTLHLTVRSRRYRPTASVSLSARPPVAIHLPVYNEFYVVRRLLDSCVRVAVRYGKEKVKVYIIDDSTDETSREVDRVVSAYSSQGFNFEVIRRGNRAGFKAGALQSALEKTKEKYVAVLDADFVPPPDFLDRTVALLESDPKVGFVQARWGHLDRNHSVVTESVAIGVDGHFFLEQRGRNGSGYLMNFNGSAGVLRAEAIRTAGGWASDTLAEDLDLSYRIQLAGFRGEYMNDLEVPGELPPTITSLKRQQGRWARGSLQTAKKLVGHIRTSDNLTVGQKFEAGIHLTYYLVHPLMVASFLLAVSADFLSLDVIKYAVNVSIPTQISGLAASNPIVFSFLIIPWIFFSALVALSTFAVLLYCIAAVRIQKLGLIENIKQITILVLIGYGISISNSVQAISGIFSRQTGTFSRTPKYALVDSSQSWKGKKYQIPINKTVFLEAGAVALAVVAMFRAFQTSNLGIIPILVIYLLGYAFVLYLTIQQSFFASGSIDA